MGEIRQQTLHGIKWTAIERFSIQGVNFFLGIFVARLLTPADYGLIGMLGIFFAISQTFIDSGFSNALIRKQNCTEQDYSTVFYFNVIIGLFCTFVLYLSSPFIAEFFNQPVLENVTKLYCINLFLGSLCGVQFAKLTQELNFKSQAKVNFVSALLSGIIGLILAYLNYGVWALVWQAIAANIIRSVALFISVRWLPALVFSKESFNELFGYGSKLLAAGLLHTIYGQLSTLFIGKFYTPKDLGNYSRGGSMAMLPVNTISGIMQKVTFPIFAKLQDDDEKLIAVYRKYMKFNGLILCYLCTVLAFLAKPLVLLLLKEQWSGAVIFLQLFCFACMFDPLCTLNLNLLQIKGRSDLFLRLEILKKGISIIMLIASVPLGVLAICIMKVIYAQVAVAINTFYTGKLFGIGYIKQLKDFLPYLIYSVVACSICVILAYIFTNNLILLISGVSLSCVIYLFILHLTKDQIYQEYLLPAFIRCLNKFKK